MMGLQDEPEHLFFVSRLESSIPRNRLPQRDVLTAAGCTVSLDANSAGMVHHDRH